MINILLDECLPKKLKYRVEELAADFNVKTVQQAGWRSLPAGKLLANAEENFEVFGLKSVLLRIIAKSEHQP